MDPRDLVREKMKAYKTNYEDQAKNMDRKDWIQALTEHPELIQRPILIWDDTARIGRPPEPAIEAYKKQITE